jgi:hypothetical protein
MEQDPSGGGFQGRNAGMLAVKFSDELFDFWQSPGEAGLL